MSSPYSHSCVSLAGYTLEVVKNCPLSFSFQCQHRSLVGLFSSSEKFQNVFLLSFFFFFLVWRHSTMLCCAVFAVVVYFIFSESLQSENFSSEEYGSCYFFFFPHFVLLFKSICLHFPPTPAIPTSYPRSYPPLVLSTCPSYMFLKTLLPFPPLAPPTSPLVTVSLPCYLFIIASVPLISLLAL